MKYGVHGEVLKRRKISGEGSSSVATKATSSSAPRTELGSFSKELPSTFVSVPVTVPVSETGRDESVFDRDLLDCSICVERLKSPIYQCRNGHVACASCCKLTKHVCSSCQQPTGVIRCLILEKLIESLKEKCKNIDCPARVKCSERYTHEKICPYGSVNCPMDNCDFKDLPYNLLRDHMRQKHPEHWIDHLVNAGTSTILVKPKHRYHVVFSAHLCFVLHRNQAVTVYGNYDRSVGDMCYFSVLKVLSERYAGEFSYKMKLKTVPPEGRNQSSTFTIESLCSVDDDDPENYLRDDGFVVVAEDMPIEVEIAFSTTLGLGLS